ncbi:MAG: hypothetical protein ACFHWX_02155 [Bacteroidota bacterium]
MNTLSTIARTDSAYTNLSIQLLINLMKIADQNPDERSLNLEKVSEILEYRRLQGLEYLGTEDGGYLLTEVGEKIITGSNYSPFVIDGINFEMVLLTDTDIRGLIFQNCNFSGSYITGNLNEVIFKNCKMDSVFIASVGNPFSIENCYVIAREVVLKSKKSNDHIPILLRNDDLVIGDYLKRNVSIQYDFEFYPYMRLNSSIKNITILEDKKPSPSEYAQSKDELNRENLLWPNMSLLTKVYSEGDVNKGLDHGLILLSAIPQSYLPKLKELGYRTQQYEDWNR